jgi:hypothetical protein
MRITGSGLLKALATLSFLLAGGLLVAILKYECCGVAVFSPQVSWGDRLLFLSIPAVPLAVGLLLLLRRSGKEGP